MKRLIEYTSWSGLWRPVVKYSIVFAAACALLLGLMILLLAGCGGSSSGMSGGGKIIYEGPIYGDFITLYDQVRDCKGVQGIAVPAGGQLYITPRIIIYDSTFDCSGVKAGGCYLNGEIGMVGTQAGDPNNLIDSQGSLFSHELAHFFQELMGQPFDESDPCGKIKLPGFKI